MWMFSCFSLDEDPITNEPNNNETSVISEDDKLQLQRNNRIDKLVINTGTIKCEYWSDDQLYEILSNKGIVRPTYVIEHIWDWPPSFSPSIEWLEDENKIKQILDVEKDFEQLSQTVDYYSLAVQTDFPLNKATIVRYLEAFQWVVPGPGVKTTAERIIDTIQWRQSFPLPCGLKAKEILRKELETGKNFTIGSALDGRPIVYILLGEENTWDPVGNSMALIYTLERAVATMTNSVQETVCIVDCAGVGMTNTPSTSFVTMLVDILGKHYPRRNGKIFICNVSSIFYFVWNMISMSLSEVARSKVIILTSDLDEMRNKICEIIDVNELWTRFGGNKVIEYDVNSYLAQDAYLAGGDSVVNQ